jgi:alpha-methylacyl-CoA racemase
MGPLQGIRILEFAGIGPGPFAAMMLSDMGADVLRLDRAGSVREPTGEPSGDILNRGRRSVGLDLDSGSAPTCASRAIRASSTGA